MIVQKLSEVEARAQLQRYALRCHVNEKEKEQLHKRNRELNVGFVLLNGSFLMNLFTQLLHS